MLQIPRWAYVSGVSVVVIGIAAGLIWMKQPASQKTISTPSPTQATSVATPTSTPATPTPTPLPVVTPTPGNTHGLIPPLPEFTTRITKKKFDTYITPATSPVQPERFTGYHTGVDVEYGDVTADVPVHAVADGEVVFSQWVSGYGGLFVEKSVIDGRSIYVLYGHLRSSSMVAKGKSVHQGDVVGLLGTAYSTETDGERRHLHLAFYIGKTLDVRGYVQSKGELASWVDPLLYY